MHLLMPSALFRESRQSCTYRHRTRWSDYSNWQEFYSAPVFLSTARKRFCRVGHPPTIRIFQPLVMPLPLIFGFGSPLYFRVSVVGYKDRIPKNSLVRFDGNSDLLHLPLLPKSQPEYHSVQTLRDMSILVGKSVARVAAKLATGGQRYVKEQARMAMPASKKQHAFAL